VRLFNATVRFPKRLLSAENNLLAYHGDHQTGLSRNIPPGEKSRTESGVPNLLSGLSSM
jgi:hypothetical protein